MPDLIALRAMFGQDEGNHGTARYRVAVDHLIHVPKGVASYLVNKGGFAAEPETVAGDSPQNHGFSLAIARTTPPRVLRDLQLSRMHV